jgi:hypothetical protein
MTELLISKALYPFKAPLPLKPRRPRPEVKGPIRCHKCQRKCRDATEYLEHKCEQPPQ